LLKQWDEFLTTNVSYNRPLFAEARTASLGDVYALPPRPTTPSDHPSTPTRSAFKVIRYGGTSDDALALSETLKEYHVVIKANSDDTSKTTTFKDASYALGLPNRRTEVKGAHAMLCFQRSITELLQM